MPSSSSRTILTPDSGKPIPKSGISWPHQHPATLQEVVGRVCPEAVGPGDGGEGVCDVKELRRHSVCQETQEAGRKTGVVK